ncbi:MAG: hypothetical protein V7745_00830 [Pseudomonadales bacterium]
MLDLIPIGTVNRTATENNAVKRSDNIQETAKTERFETEQKQKVEEPRRRFKKRQGDRRRSLRSMRAGRPDRRGSDRRDEEDDALEVSMSGMKKQKKPSRKGRIIDERA